jgi:hypothetical protein
MSNSGAKRLVRPNQRDNKHKHYDIFFTVAVNERFFMQCAVASIAMKGERNRVGDTSVMYVKQLTNSQSRVTSRS